jgi:hypothetical protein
MQPRAAVTRYHRDRDGCTKTMLSDFPWDQHYCISSIEDVLTPALLLYPEIVASNIERTVGLLGGDPDRWRVHIKTAKLGYTVRMLVESGIRNFKCATTLELLVACRSAARDVRRRQLGLGKTCHADLMDHASGFQSDFSHSPGSFFSAILW